MDDQMEDEYRQDESSSEDDNQMSGEKELLQGLPSAEDIYDLDTESLRSLLGIICSRKESAPAESPAFRRLNKLGEIVQLEIDERHISADFEQNCLEILNSWQNTVDIAQNLINDVDEIKPLKAPLGAINKIGTGNASGRTNLIEQPARVPSKRQQLPPLPHEDLLSQQAANSEQLLTGTTLQNVSNLQSTHNSSRESGSVGYPRSWDQHVLGSVKGGSKQGAWKDFVKQTLVGTKMETNMVTVASVNKRPPKPIIKRADSGTDSIEDLHQPISRQRPGNKSSTSTQGSAGSLAHQPSLSRPAFEAGERFRAAKQYDADRRTKKLSLASRSPGMGSVPVSGSRTGLDVSKQTITPLSSKSTSGTSWDYVGPAGVAAAHSRLKTPTNSKRILIGKPQRGKSFGEPANKLNQPISKGLRVHTLVVIDHEELSSVVGVTAPLLVELHAVIETSGFVEKQHQLSVCEPISKMLECAQYGRLGSKVSKLQSTVKVSGKPSTSNARRNLEASKGKSETIQHNNQKISGRDQTSAKVAEKKQEPREVENGKKGLIETKQNERKSENQVTPGQKFQTAQRGLKEQKSDPNADDDRKVSSRVKDGKIGTTKPQTNSGQPEADVPTPKSSGTDSLNQTSKRLRKAPSKLRPDLVTPIYPSEADQTRKIQQPAEQEASMKCYPRLPSHKKPPKAPTGAEDEEGQSGSIRTISMATGTGFGHGIQSNPSPLSTTAGYLSVPHLLGEIAHDYSLNVPTWAHLFSEYYNSGPEMDLLATMRDILQQYVKHVEVMKRMDSRLLEIAFSLSPLEYGNLNADPGMHDLIYKQDKNKLLSYISKTCIKWEAYRNRQEVYLKTLDHREDVEEAENEDESEGDTPSTINTGARAAASQQSSKQKQFFRVVKSKTEVYDIITKSFYRRHGWRELPHGLNLGASWNLLWAWGKVQVDMKKVLIFQRINHFSNIKHIGRKDNLKRSLERLMSMNSANQRFFNILPESYNIPRDYSAFATASVTMREQEPTKEQVWIVKPAALSRGRGIYLIKSYLDLSYSESVVVQRYITNPLLLEGYKFDLRIYVLVTSFQPLEVFLYKEGFARFASEKFTLDSEE